MRNRSLKSEFIGAYVFHADPVVVNEFPSRLHAGGATGILPLPDAICPDFIE